MPPTYKEVLKSCLRELKRIKGVISKTPFVNNDKELIIHCCHFRVGTSWFSNILGEVALRFGLRFQRCNQSELRSDTDIFLEPHSHLDFSNLPPHRGSHMIRDPRDVVVSGYFYNLWSKEEWVHVPRKEFGNSTYQQYLNSIGREEGILAEIKRFSGTPRRHMSVWNYHNPDFIEIRYEELIKNEGSIMYDIFKHYGFGQEAISVSVAIAKRFSFRQLTKREIGQIKERSHFRCGSPGYWREVFTERNKIDFKHLAGDILIKLGYEKNNDW